MKVSDSHSIKKRETTLDAFRGVLILLVVIGHSTEGIVHDIIFLFHMPLFYILSGYLIKDNVFITKEYLIKSAKRLFIPYFVYMAIDCLFIRRSYSLNMMLRMIWGGRYLTGVYWYITCYFFSLIIFIAMKNLLNKKLLLVSITLMSVLAIIEANAKNHVYWLAEPGIPWNLDVCLLAIVYLFIGYYLKNNVKFSDKPIKIHIFLPTLILLASFIFVNNIGHLPFFYMNMKKVCYNEWICSLLIPLAFGIIIYHFMILLKKATRNKAIPPFIRIPLQIFRFLMILFGRISIVIMYVHIPINHWQSRLNYGKITYVFVGLLAPCLLSILFSKNTILRMAFGLSEINYREIWNDSAL